MFVVYRGVISSQLSYSESILRHDKFPCCATPQSHPTQHSRTKLHSTSVRKHGTRARTSPSSTHPSRSHYKAELELQLPQIRLNWLISGSLKQTSAVLSVEHPMMAYHALMVHLSSSTTLGLLPPLQPGCASRKSGMEPTSTWFPTRMAQTAPSSRTSKARFG